MVRRDGGAHGVLHTGHSLHFCRCGCCIKARRQAQLDPSNAGKTQTQLLHEGHLGYEQNAEKRRKEKAAYVSLSRVDFKQQTSKEIREFLANEEYFEDALVQQPRDSTLLNPAAGTSVHIHAGAPQSQLPPVTLAQYMPIERLASTTTVGFRHPVAGASKKVSKPTTAPLCPAPVIPGVVTWPVRPVPQSVAAADPTVAALVSGSQAANPVSPSIHAATPGQPAAIGRTTSTGFVLTSPTASIGHVSPVLPAAVERTTSGGYVLTSPTASMGPSSPMSGGWTLL